MFSRSRGTRSSGFTYLVDLAGDGDQVKGCRVMLTGNGKVLEVVSLTEVVAKVQIDDVRSVDIATTADGATMTTLRCASHPPVYLWRAGDESEAMRALLVPMAALQRMWAKRGGD